MEDPGFTSGVVVADAAGANAAVDAALDRMRGSTQPVSSRTPTPRADPPARTEATRADVNANPVVGATGTRAEPVSATRAPGWHTPAPPTATPTRPRGAW